MTTEQGMDPALAQAFRELLSYMLTESGLEWQPGIGMSIRGDGDGFEVLVGSVPIGHFDRAALLASAAAIRRSRGN